jgi:hypothetical protein
MKLLNFEVEKRISVKLNKQIKTDTISGIMNFGAVNDYPQVIEKLILGSQTAKASASIYAKFIAGDGFENPEIGKEIVGVDNKGKPITLDNIRRNLAESLARNNGGYIHCNENLAGEVGNTRVVPFKFCRLSKEDDNGFCGNIAVYNDWTKENQDIRKFDKKDIVWFPHFNLIPEVLASNIKDCDGIKNFKGQIYSIFLDDTYLYPLSPFDSVYLDMDTEYQIQLFKNREIRNGFTDKLLLFLAPPNDETEAKEMREKVRSWMGPDGDKEIVFEAEFDENGELKDKGSFKAQELKSNINDKLFADWEKGIANNIRKAAKGLPSILIDYETGTLSGTSGEAITQAVEYYNALTAPMREIMSEVLKDIYSHHKSDVLKNNTNWKLNDVSLITSSVVSSEEDALKEKQKAQAILRGSVGGVTSLIALQQAVSSGASDVEAAVATVVEIYGIPDATARKMIGTPKIVNSPNYIPKP